MQMRASSWGVAAPADNCQVCVGPHVVGPEAVVGRHVGDGIFSNGLGRGKRRQKRGSLTRGGPRAWRGQQRQGPQPCYWGHLNSHIFREPYPCSCYDRFSLANSVRLEPKSTCTRFLYSNPTFQFRNATQLVEMAWSSLHVETLLLSLKYGVMVI